MSLFLGTVATSSIRTTRGESLVGILVATAILAGVGGLTAVTVSTRESVLKGQIIMRFAEFIDYFDQLASEQTANNWDNPAFQATSLAGSYPLTPESTKEFVNVDFQGCVKPATLLAVNNRSPEEIQALFAQAAVETPALSIYEGSGQTGGILINEPYDRKLSDSPVLFSYLLTGPKESGSHLMYIIGDTRQCPP